MDLNSTRYFKKDEAYFNSFSNPRNLSIMDPQDDTNDIARNTFAWNTIRYEFIRAFDLLQSMFGAAYAESKLPKSDRHRIVTVLGSILTIKREVIEVRDRLETLWHEIREGQVVLKKEWLFSKNSKINIKKSDHVEVEFVEDDSEPYNEQMFLTGFELKRSDPDSDESDTLSNSKYSLKKNEVIIVDSDGHPGNSKNITPSSKRKKSSEAISTGSSSNNKPSKKKKKKNVPTPKVSPVKKSKKNSNRSKSRNDPIGDPTSFYSW